MFPLALLLSLAIVEVTTHGAVANDATSDSQAFRDAFAAAGPGDTVHAGAGTWDLPRIDSQSAVYLSGRSGITFDGEGPTTILKMAGGTHVGDYHVFNVFEGSNLTFKDFACDGNRSNIVSADEQTHCLNINGVAGFVATDLTLSHVYGDGVRFIGTRDTMTDVVATNLTMDDNGRSGIAIGGGARFLLTNITATNISDQGIDTEPNGGAPGLDDITITGCYIGAPTTPGAAALSIAGGTDSSTDVLVTDCEVLGPLNINGVDRVTLRDVIIRSSSFDAVTVAPSATNVVLDRVRIEARHGYNGIHMTSNESSNVSDWTLTDVRVTVDRGRGFSLDGGGPGRITMTDAHIKGSHPWIHSGATGIFLHNQLATDTAEIVIDDVEITGVGTGITVQRLIAAGAIEVAATGSIDLDRAGSAGTSCDNVAQVTFDRTGLTVSATTPNSGCP